MTAPLVSIGLPVHNGERFLLRTLQSVANQTQKPDRLVVTYSEPR